MKKIAIVTNSAWQAYNFRLNLARALKNDGYKVIFMAPYDKKYSQLIKKEFEYYDFYMDAKGINPLIDINTIFQLYKLFKIIKPDVVLSFTIKPNIYSSIVAGFLGIKVISNITGLGTLFIKSTFATKIAKLLYRVALRYNTKVFFQNSDDGELFIKNNLVSKSKIDLLPGSGVDIKRFYPMAKDKNDKFIFLLIARLLRDKGILEYVKAAKIIKKRYDNIEFLLLGAVGVANKTAIKKDELQSWIDSGLVRYLGVTDNVQQVISGVDCVVLPSYREGIPRSLLEASSMEKPIISANVVGCREVVDDGVNGYLCEVKNVDDLVCKMEKMVKLSKEERGVMGRAGRKKVVKVFDEKIVLDRYLDVVNSVSYSV